MNMEKTMCQIAYIAGAILFSLLIRALITVHHL